MAGLSYRGMLVAGVVILRCYGVAETSELPLESTGALGISRNQKHIVMQLFRMDDM